MDIERFAFYVISWSWRAKKKLEITRRFGFMKPVGDCLNSKFEEFLLFYFEHRKQYCPK
jgi:hypothetical protein